MSEQTPPYPYFNGIIYSQSLFGSSGGQYLERTGVATSVATKTTFNGPLYTGGITDSSTISSNNLSVSGTLSLPANSIQDSTLSSNVNLLNSAQTITAVKTFSSAPVMSGSSITASSIPDTSLSSNVALKNGTQTFSGTNTFSIAPVMSGSSITASSIPDTSLSSNVALKNGTQTFSGTNTFSIAPVMSGSSITASSVPNSALQSSVALLTGAQTFSGSKTFSSLLTSSGINDSSTINANNENVLGTFTQGLNYYFNTNLSTIFSGTYTNSTQNPLTSITTTSLNYTYLFITGTQNITYTGIQPITLNYVLIGGGGCGGAGHYASSIGGAGGGGGSGLVVKSTISLGPGDVFNIAIGLGGDVVGSQNGDSSVIGKNGLVVATANGGSSGLSTTTNNGGNGGSSGGGVAGGNAGASGLIGSIGSSNTLSSSGGGGSGYLYTAGQASGGVLLSSNMADGTSFRNGICNGGSGGYYSSNTTANLPANYYGSGGTGGNSFGPAGYYGSNGIQGCLLIYFSNVNNFTVSNSQITVNSPATFNSSSTFNSAPIMSGALITASSIPNSALQTTVSLTNLSVSGTLALPSNSVQDSDLSSNVALLSGIQTFSDQKTFSNTIVSSGINDSSTINANNENVLGSFTQGLNYTVANNLSTYFLGGTFSSSATNPLSSSTTTGRTYVLFTVNQTMTYKGLQPITLNYIVIGGGGNGGSSSAPYPAASGGGGGAGAFLSGTTTLSYGDSIALVVGAVGSTSTLTVGSTLIASAAGGSNGGNGVTSSNIGGVGGTGGGGSPVGGAGGITGSSYGQVGSFNSISASGGGGNATFNTAQNGTGGAFTNTMADGAITSNICIGGTGGFYSNTDVPVVSIPTTYYGSGGNGGNGYGTVHAGSSGVKGAIMFFFTNNLNFQVQNNSINTGVPITPIYQNLPSYGTNAIGYSVRNTLTSATLTSSWVRPTGGQITLASVGVYLLTYAFSSKNVGSVLMGCLTLSSTAPYTSPQTTDPASNTFAFSGSTPQNSNWTSVTNTYVFNNSTANTNVYMYWASSGSQIPPSTGNYFQAVRIA